MPDLSEPAELFDNQTGNNQRPSFFIRGLSDRLFLIHEAIASEIISRDFLHQVHTIIFQIETVVTVMRHVAVAVGKIDLTLKFTPKDWH